MYEVGSFNKDWLAIRLSWELNPGDPYQFYKVEFPMPRPKNCAIFFCSLVLEGHCLYSDTELVLNTAKIVNALCLAERSLVEAPEQDLLGLLESRG